MEVGMMEKNSEKEWELMGTKLLLQQMKKERARGDEVVRVTRRQSLWKVSPRDAEQLPGFEVGDWDRILCLPGLWRGDPLDLEIEKMFEVVEWVRLKDNVNHWKSIGPGSVGVVQGIGYEGNEVDISTFVGFCEEQEKWVGPRNTHASIGTIQAIDANGKLRIYTPAGSKTWMLDPSEVEVVEENELCIGD
ncbi:hypothetical protein RJT34_20293 [Clitoria ternatea]|uniref:Mind bomb SH3 repeat domain-containing protein n=1 Tax=Clitoria ternatea TaxID=43366 RepID=A0AAN9IT77_CLITE